MDRERLIEQYLSSLDEAGFELEEMVSLVDSKVERLFEDYQEPEFVFMIENLKCLIEDHLSGENSPPKGSLFRRLMQHLKIARSNQTIDLGSDPKKKTEMLPPPPAVNRAPKPEPKDRTTKYKELHGKSKERIVQRQEEKKAASEQFKTANKQFKAKDRSLQTATAKASELRDRWYMGAKRSIAMGKLADEEKKQPLTDTLRGSGERLKVIQKETAKDRTKLVKADGKVMRGKHEVEHHAGKYLEAKKGNEEAGVRVARSKKLPEYIKKRAARSGIQVEEMLAKILNMINEAFPEHDDPYSEKQHPDSPAAAADDKAQNKERVRKTPLDAYQEYLEWCKNNNQVAVSPEQWKKSWSMRSYPDEVTNASNH